MVLDGSIMHVASILPAAIYASEIKKGIICPWSNRVEARVSRNKKSIASQHLKQIIAYLNGESDQEEITSEFLCNFKMLAYSVK